MSAQPLTGPGFFGKMPATGDFVSRGLEPGFRRHVDRWVGLRVLPVFGRDALPSGGLRFVLAARDVAGVAVASRDGAGRDFPLVAVVPAERPDRGCVDAWVAAVMPVLEAAVAGEAGPDELMAGLEGVLPPVGASDEAGAWFWTDGGEVVGDLAELA